MQPGQERRQLASEIGQWLSELPRLVTVVPSAKAVTRHGRGRIAADSSAWSGRGTGSPAPCSRLSS